MAKNNENNPLSLFELIEKRQWSDALRKLEEGKEYVFRLPSTQAIHSFKSVAYKFNTDRIGRRYSIDANKETKVVTITVKSV